MCKTQIGIEGSKQLVFGILGCAIFVYELSDAAEGVNSEMKSTMA